MKANERLLLAAIPFILSSCAAPIEPQSFNGPNGKPAYSMQCSGMGRTLDGCYKKAGEICPNGYSIISSGESVVGLPVNGGMMMAPNRNLAIECK